MDVDSTIPNLALMHISAWRKSLGDEVGFNVADPDRVYASCVFDWNRHKTDGLRTFYPRAEIDIGGSGISLGSSDRIPEEVWTMSPDYTLYPECDYDLGFTTRGCIRNCHFCVVPKKEGRLHRYQHPSEFHHPSHRKAVYLDNNILAAGDYAVEQMEKIIERGYRVDFNQALDARLVTDRFARLLAKIRWIDRRIRFGCDTHGQIAECERAIDMINGYGYRGEYFLYTMIGGKSDFKESFERVNYWWKRNHEQREKHLPNIYPYAQPYRNPDNPREPVPEWQKDIARWVNKHQCFQMTDFANFEPRKGFKCETYLKELL